MHQVIDVSDLPKAFVDAIEAAIRAYRDQIAPMTGGPRPIGWASHVLPELPDSFFEPIPDDVLDLFEGKAS